MDVRSFDLNLLLVFDAVWREGNVTAAATRLGMTQPAVSRAIQRLRAVYHDPLFVRATGGMKPTALAQVIATPVNDALTALRGALDLNASFDPATSTRTFNLVMTDGAALFYLPRLFPQIKKEAPGVRIRMLQMPRDQYRDALETGSAELALGQMPTMQRNFHQQHLFDDELVCLMRKDHPDIGQTLSMAQFMAAEHIVMSAPSRLDDLLKRALGRAAAQRRVGLNLPYYLVIPATLATCDLIAAVPRQVGVAFADNWNLKMLPLPFRLPPMRLSQFWHARSHQDLGHQWLRRTIARLFMQEHGGPAARTVRTARTTQTAQTNRTAHPASGSGTRRRKTG